MSKIAVVIPCFRVTKQILSVLEKIEDNVSHIYVVDDACPEHTGDFVRENCHDPRVQVLFHEKNQGVGGAVKTGFKKAIQDGVDVIVKIDGDGQMDPELLPRFVKPILNGRADYTKGNRFFKPEDVKAMPRVRFMGNLGLSFLTKLSSGYWQVFDPTNGYLALNAKVAAELPLDKIHDRYFFESDMLFRLNTLKAKIIDIPMKAIYGDEVSNLSTTKETFRFFVLNMKNFGKRVLYNYFLRDFNLASLNLVLGLILLLAGAIFGFYHWLESVETGTPATAGTVMLAAMPILMGFFMVLSFLNYDLSQRHDEVISHDLKEYS